MTRAVLVTTRQWSEKSVLAERHSPSLLPFVDRPFIQHVIEYLINREVTHFDLILCQFPEKFEALLGDGTRWGARIRYHLVKDPSRPYRPIKFLDIDQDADPVLLIHTDCLPQVDILKTKPSASSNSPILYCWGGNTHNQEERLWNWTGWAWLPGKCRTSLPDNVDENDLLSYLLSGSGSQGIPVDVPKPFSVRSYGELFSAHKSALAKAFPGLMINAREIEDGIWFSRNVSLHPTTRIIPPVTIGEDCKIAKGAHLGPNVVIGNNCVISSHSVIADSIIFPGSYVGEGLELRDVLVDKNLLINIRIGSELTIIEDFILGSLVSSGDGPTWLKNLLSRTVALVFLLLTFPVLLGIGLYHKLRCRGSFFLKSEMVRLPADSKKEMWRTFSLLSFFRKDESAASSAQGKNMSNAETMHYRVGWRDFFCRFLPALINIAQGNLHFVGVKPKTKGEIEALSHDWRDLYLKTKAGIVTESLVKFGKILTEEELCAAETIYAVSADFRYDLGLLAKYFGQILGLVPKPGSETYSRIGPQDSNLCLH